MNLEQFNEAKILLSQIEELEKKASVKLDYNTVRIMVSNNGKSFTEAASIIGRESADKYVSNILNECNNSKEIINEQLKKLYEQFDKL